MKIGVSTACLYPMEVEQALAVLLELGIPQLEVFLNTDSELDASFCQALHGRAEVSGASVLALHPFTSGFEPMYFFSNYARRFEDGRRLYRRICQAARAMGAEMVVFHGGWSGSPLPWEEYFRRYGILLADAGEEGVQLVHENVARCVGRDPEFFRQMKEALPQASFVLDVKQAVRSGVSPYEMAEAMGGRVRHLHISDHGEKGDCLPLGQGTLDLPRLVEALHQDQPPSMVLELYRSGYETPAQLQDSYKIMVERFKITNS